MIPENNRLQRIFFIFIGLILTCRTFGMDICDKVDEDKNYIDLVNPFVDSHRSRWFSLVQRVVRLVWSVSVLIRIPSTLGDRDIYMAQNKYVVSAMFIIGRRPEWQ